MSAAPEALPIDPSGPLDATVRVPGSKSITNRALLLAALAAGESELAGPLASDDTDVMRIALGQLGARIEIRGDPWLVTGTGGQFTVPAKPLYVENSGTTARFLTAACTLAPGPVEIDGNPRMRERPIVRSRRRRSAASAPSSRSRARTAARPYGSPAVACPVAPA